MTGALAQVGALLHLRWQMARGTGLRTRIVLGALLVGWLLTLCLSSAEALDDATLATAIQLAPSAFLGFGVLALIAPIAGGGGNEVVPTEQLAAFPVRPSTLFLAGLALAPVNLVWLLQLMVLSALTSYLTLDGSLLRGLLTTAAYVGALTGLGQTLAWVLAGLRQSRRGRWLVRSCGAGLLVATVVVLRSGSADTIRDGTPVRGVVRAVISGGAGLRPSWLATTGVLLVFACVALLFGTRACAWALTRTPDAGAGLTDARVRRRSPKAGQLRELVAIDHASIWRAPALRRGGLVLAVLPGVVAAGAAVPWQTLIVLPGLVAAGAGLLFGVNAFCLDGPGAVWLASLPHDPALVARAKTIVLSDTVGATVLVAVIAGAVRSPGDPTAAQATALLSSTLACSALVVAGCLKSSVRRPHRADLRGARDAVAPPGALVMASVRLTLPVAFLGLLLGLVSQLQVWWWPPLLAMPVLLLALLSVLRSLRAYADPWTRARIVDAVARG